MYNYNEMIKMGFITRDENTMINEETNQIAIKCVTHCPYIVINPIFIISL